jgi:TonB-dependent starch-binding outer membrane protein SusC
MGPWLRRGWNQGYNLSVRGGGDDLQYFVSGSVSSNEGVLINDWENRASIRGNFQFSPAEHLTIQWNTSYSEGEVHNTPQGNNEFGINLNAMRRDPAREIAVNYIGSWRDEDISRLLDMEIRNNTNRLVMGVTANYTPNSGPAHRTVVGIDRAGAEMKNYRPVGYIGYPSGALSNRVWNGNVLTVDYLGTYRRGTVGELVGTLSWGAQGVTTDEHNIGGLGDGLPPAGHPTISSGARSTVEELRTRVVNAGLFAQTMIGFKDRYFLTAGLRADGNSAFGSDFGVQFYPRANVSYVVSDEPFWPANLGVFRLRAAYGQAGRAPGAFDAVRTWNPLPWLGGSGLVAQNVGNPDLGPERTNELEMGFDAGLLDDRLSMAFSYYNRITHDALISRRRTPSEGFEGSQLANSGKFKNSGFEVQLDGQVLDTHHVAWDVGVSAYTNNSEVLDLGGTAPFAVTGSAGWIYEGYPVPVVRGRAVLNPDEYAEPDIADNHLFGPNAPTHIFGIHTSVRLPHGIALTGRGEYQGGHYIQDLNHTFLVLRGVAPACEGILALLEGESRNQLTARERERCDRQYHSTNSGIVPGDFFRLREVSMSLPVARALPGVANARLTMSAHNFLSWIKDDFLFDPEIASGGMNQVTTASIEVIPPPRTFTASLRVVF